MKKYTFELVIYEDSDDFWNDNPTCYEVEDMVDRALDTMGLSSSEYNHNLLILRKYENVEEDNT